MYDSLNLKREFIDKVNMWKDKLAYAKCQRTGSDCKCTGYERGCSEKAVL